MIPLRDLKVFKVLKVFNESEYNIDERDNIKER